MNLRLVIAVALASFAYAIGVQAQSEPEVRVTGTVSHSQKTVALLEIRATPNRQWVRPILREGEKTEGVELVSIAPEQGIVVVKVNEATSSFIVDGTAPGTVAPTLNLRDADSPQVLEIYQEISGRTVLRAETLPSARINLRSSGRLATEEAVKLLESTLLEKGILFKNVGEKFVAAVSVNNEWALAELPALPQDKATGGTFPAGMIKFQAADIWQALEVYQELAGRTVLAGPGLQGKITVRTQTSLSRQEGVWAMQAVMQLSGTRVVHDGVKFAVATPVGAEGLPALKAKPSPVRLEKSDPLPPGMLKFRDADLSAVLGVYAALCQRRADPPERMPLARFMIRSQTALTSEEALYALDTVAALHGVEFAPVGDDQITIRPYRARVRDAAPPSAPN